MSARREPASEQLRVLRIDAHRLRFVAVVAALVALSAFTIGVFSGRWKASTELQYPGSPALTPAFGLRVMSAPNRLRVLWDKGSPLIRESVQATLRIRQRNMQYEIELPRLVLYEGTCLIVGPDDIIVTMKLKTPGGSTITESALVDRLAGGSLAPASDKQPSQNARAMIESPARVLKGRLQSGIRNQ